MGLKRYLIYFSYIGTPFRGLQRQTSRNVEGISNDPSTVQGLLEIALQQLKPKNPVITLCASRTDRGVHALRSAATVDLDFSYAITPVLIQKFMNRFFDETELPVRIQEICQVRLDFSARKLPLWRKYIYRFAILKPESLAENIADECLPIPINEFDRCYFVRDSRFDLEAVNEACKVFIGTRDFITFMGKPTIQPDNVSTMRCVHQLYVEPAPQTIPSSYANYFNYWHLTCSGKSFVFNQIRRTLTVLLAVGQGKLTIYDVEQMFLEPSPSSYPSGLQLAPACGLYLADIFYDPLDLIVPDDTESSDEKAVPDPEEIQKSKKELLLERLNALKLHKEK